MRHAFITGGSSGIGLALGEELASRGYAVTLSARRQELLEEAVARLNGAGHAAFAVACDVTDAASVASSVALAVNRLGPIDLAVANAGVGIPTKATKFDLADAKLTMETNFYGTLHLFAAVVPMMIERGSGRFAGIASLAGLRGLPGTSMYSTSKAAMQTFLEASRVELRRTGVGVTIVNPGFITTAMTENNRFSMPFLMDAPRAARIIADGIEKGSRIVQFPLPMSLLMRITRLLPAALYDRILSSRRRGSRSRDE